LPRSARILQCRENGKPESRIPADSVMEWAWSADKKHNPWRMVGSGRAVLSPFPGYGSPRKVNAFYRGWHFMFANLLMGLAFTVGQPGPNLPAPQAAVTSPLYGSLLPPAQPSEPPKTKPGNGNGNGKDD